MAVVGSEPFPESSGGGGGGGGVGEGGSLEEAGRGDGREDDSSGSNAGTNSCQGKSEDEVGLGSSEIISAPAPSAVGDVAEQKQLKGQEERSREEEESQKRDAQASGGGVVEGHSGGQSREVTEGCGSSADSSASKDAAKQRDERGKQEGTSVEEEERRKREAEALACKDKGNKLYKEKKFLEAALWYTKGIQLAPENTALRGNRSAVYIELAKRTKEAEQKREVLERAARDSAKCVELDPRWEKGHTRLATALEAEGKLQEALWVLTRAMGEVEDAGEAKEKLEGLKKRLGEGDGGHQGDGVPVDMEVLAKFGGSEQEERSWILGEMRRREQESGAAKAVKNELQSTMEAYRAWREGRGEHPGAKHIYRGPPPGYRPRQFSDSDSDDSSDEEPPKKAPTAVAKGASGAGGGGKKEGSGGQDRPAEGTRSDATSAAGTEDGGGEVGSKGVKEGEKSQEAAHGIGSSKEGSETASGAGAAASGERPGADGAAPSVPSTEGEEAPLLGMSAAAARTAKPSAKQQQQQQQQQQQHRSSGIGGLFSRLAATLGLKKQHADVGPTGDSPDVDKEGKVVDAGRSASAGDDKDKEAFVPTKLNKWAFVLGEERMYEWFLDCYRFQESSSPDSTNSEFHAPTCPRLALLPFLFFCKLALARGVLPPNWNWPKLLTAAREDVWQKLSYEEAGQRYGRMVLLQAANDDSPNMITTSEHVYGCQAGEAMPEKTRQALRDIAAGFFEWRHGEPTQVFNDVGGKAIWARLARREPERQCSCKASKWAKQFEAGSEEEGGKQKQEVKEKGGDGRWDRRWECKEDWAKVGDGSALPNA